MWGPEGRQPSVSQAERSHHNPALLTPWSWASSAPNCGEHRCLLFKPFSLWYLVMTVQADYCRSLLQTAISINHKNLKHEDNIMGHAAFWLKFQWFIDIQKVLAVAYRTMYGRPWALHWIPLPFLLHPNHWGNLSFPQLSQNISLLWHLQYILFLCADSSFTFHVAAFLSFFYQYKSHFLGEISHTVLSRWANCSYPLSP